MKVLTMIAIFSLSPYVQASVQCEQKMEAHFKQLGMDTNKLEKQNDYTKPTTVDEEKKLYDMIKKMAESKTEQDLKKLEEELDRTQVMDSRKNEIIRVCSSIKTFVELGLPAKDIEMKTLSYQNGWSNGMREPLTEVIADEMADYKNISENFKVKGVDLEPYFCTPNGNETECTTTDGRVYKLAVAGHQQDASLTVNDSNRSFFKKLSDIFSFKREGPPAPVEDRTPTLSK